MVKVLAMLCLFGLLAACGGLQTRGTVLHPMYKYKEGDTEAPRPPRLLVIERRENRVMVKHTIVGPQGRPMALELLGEFASIPQQDSNGNGLIIEILLFSNYKNELSEGSGLGQYEYWLELPDGRKIKGQLHVQGKVKDHSMKITGMHMEPHLTTVNKSTGEVKVYRHVEEVENDFELFSRWGRIVFVAEDLMDLKTPYVVLVIKGFQRTRRYHFDFTLDPAKAMDWAAKHLNEKMLDPALGRGH